MSFLYPNLREAVDYTSQLGLEVHINTNGVLLDENISWLQKVPHVFVKVSLDGLTSSLVQRLAGVNYLDRILHGIQRGVNAGIVQRINVVLRANPQCDVVAK